MSELPAVERFVTSSSVTVYRIPCEVFPRFIGYVYLLLGAGPPTLVDAGSGYGHSTQHVLEGLDRVAAEFGEPITVCDVARIFITHGHIDHFGGLPELRERNGAAVGIHELDRRVLTAYEESVLVATKHMRVFLQQAGVEGDDLRAMLELYGFSKKHVHAMPVDFTLDEQESIDGMTFLHVPGHCPGQVCIAIGDVLLSADHVLPLTTPHQAPESITPYTGLGHYFESLDKVHRTGGIDLALGGHEQPIHNVYERIERIRASHRRKLERLVDAIESSEDPPTIDELAKAIYPNVKGFHVLLALEEVGAHVEYLYQRGRLGVVNLDEVERDDNPALRYRAT